MFICFQIRENIIWHMCANEGETINIELPGNSTYQMEVIDTWNMNVNTETTVEPGNFQYKTTVPYTAIRIFKKDE